MAMLNPTMTRKQVKDQDILHKQLETRDWIQRVLGEKLPGKDGDDLHDALKDGVALCELANKMFANCIARFHPHDALPFQHRENIHFFIEICRKLGLPEAAIFQVEDLYSCRKMANVYATLFTLAEMAGAKGFPIKWIKVADEARVGMKMSSGAAISWDGMDAAAPKKVALAKPDTSSVPNLRTSAPKAPSPPPSTPVATPPATTPASTPTPTPTPAPRKPVTPEERLRALEAFLAKQPNPENVSAIHFAVQNEQTADIVDLIIKTRKGDLALTTAAGYTPLHLAVMHSMPAYVEKLVAAGCDINAVSADGDTPLHLAVERTDDAIINTLLNAHATLNVQNKDGRTPLHVAITDGSEDTVKKLMGAGASLAAADKLGNTPLHLACSVPLTPPTIKLMVDKGADPRAVNKDGNLPMHVAAETGDAAVLDILSKVTEKTSLNQINKAGNTALHVATLRGSKSIAQKLIAIGADPNVKNAENSTALQLAVDGDSTDMVDVLLSTSSIDLNTKNNEGKTPLYTAAWRGNVISVRSLIGGGANVNIKNKDGWSPMHAACGNGHLEVVKELVTAHAEVNVQDNQGTTPLYHACDNMKVAVAEYLLTVAGIDPNISAKDCWKPIHAAARRGLVNITKTILTRHRPDLRATVKECQQYNVLHLVVMASQTPSIEMLQLLVTSGADVNQQNENGMTPLHLACCVDVKPAITFLVETARARLDIKNNNGRRPLEVSCYYGFEETAKYLATKMGKKKPPKIEKHRLAAKSMDEVQPSAPPTPEEFEKHS
ncbi:ankyrin 2,3/unc44 [Pelomyxa schiedti]|nr:ankyrin 2,3/unc44 [Pelomyxa schiedti]